MGNCLFKENPTKTTPAETTQAKGQPPQSSGGLSSDAGGGLSSDAGGGLSSDAGGGLSSDAGELSAKAEDGQVAEARRFSKTGNRHGEDPSVKAQEDHADDPTSKKDHSPIPHEIHSEDDAEWRRSEKLSLNPEDRHADDLLANPEDRHAEDLSPNPKDRHSEQRSSENRHLDDPYPNAEWRRSEKLSLNPEDRHAEDLSPNPKDRHSEQRSSENRHLDDPYPNAEWRRSEKLTLNPEDKHAEDPSLKAEDILDYVVDPNHKTEKSGFPKTGHRRGEDPSFKGHTDDTSSKAENRNSKGHLPNPQDIHSEDTTLEERHSEEDPVDHPVGRVAEGPCPNPEDGSSDDLSPDTFNDAKASPIKPSAQRDTIEQSHVEMGFNENDPQPTSTEYDHEMLLNYNPEAPDKEADEVNSLISLDETPDEQEKGKVLGAGEKGVDAEQRESEVKNAELGDHLATSESEEDLYRGADEIIREREEMEIRQRVKMESQVQIALPGVRDWSSVAVAVDVLSYSDREWRGNTAKSALIKKGYTLLSQKFGGLRRVRGDNFCALRAALFQMLSQSTRLPAWLQEEDITLWPEKLVAEEELIGQWRFPEECRDRGMTGEAVERLRRSLELLRQKLQVATEVCSTQRRQLCEQTLQGGEEEYGLLEALKFLMLRTAMALHGRMQQGHDVPMFCPLLFTRDSSDCPRTFLTNHLRRVGFDSGLEQVEMFLLGYTLQMTIQVYRLYKADTEEFVTFYPDDHKEDWPFLYLVTEDDRHYNVPVDTLAEADPHRSPQLPLVSAEDVQHRRRTAESPSQAGDGSATL